jgi:hypothetical protein
MMVRTLNTESLPRNPKALRHQSGRNAFQTLCVSEASASRDNRIKFFGQSGIALPLLGGGKILCVPHFCRVFAFGDSNRNGFFAANPRTHNLIWADMAEDI